MPVESLTQATCDLALRFGEGVEDDEDRDEEMMSRPFGVSLLIAGVDEKGPALFYTDPSGTYIRWLAKAIGAGAEGAQSALQEAYYKSMTLRDAETLALRTLREVMEEKVESNNVEVAAVRTDTRKFTIYTEAQVKDCLSRLENRESQ